MMAGIHVHIASETVFNIGRNRCSRWSGTRIDHVIDVLSTYVGHASVSDTYWYVTAIPQLLALAGQRFAHAAERAVL